MTRDVEERIVAMYFDNEDFEKKAKTTIETLGQLQKGLDLKEASKGFDVFDKIGKTLNFDKAQKGLTKIKSTLSGMGSIFKKVFNLGPIDEAAAAVENFKNRYLNRVLGFDLAHTVANALEGAFRQLTIQPISAGWSQYESKMDSVKTIMSSTGESIEVVQDHLKDLTEYANKTIYSLSDMTSNLGKFTNNGQKLEDSVKAMKGIANAAADAGQGSQQASMAMYNFSQAMGVGKMTTIDWKSIENANMATTRLKDTFIEMAAAQGELHKEFSETDKKYHYYITKNSKGKTEKDKKKWTEVTAKNFRETLSKDWLTSDAMMHALQIYSGDLINANTFKSWGITDPEEIKKLQEIGQNAYESATQVRTFTKMMDALKEAAQSGWADTFELIFGDVEKGTTLWTNINEVLDDIISKSAKTRNSILEVWAGSKEDTSEDEIKLADYNKELQRLEKELNKEMSKDSQKQDAKRLRELADQIKLVKGEIKSLDDVINEKKNRAASVITDEKGRTGRDILFDKETGALFRLIDLARKFGEAFSEAFGHVFGTMDAQKLFDLTKRIGDAVDNLFSYFTESVGEEPSRLDKIKKGLQGVFSVIKTVINFIKIGFNLLKKLVGPVADVLINAFEKFGEFFDGLGDMNPVEVFQKIGEGLSKVWEKIKKFFTPQEILDKNGKGTGEKEIPAIVWLRNVWARFKGIATEWANDNGLGEVWNKLSEWWNSAKTTFEQGKAKLEKVWNDVKGWFESSGISGFLSNTWGWIVSQFSSSGNVVSGYRNGRLESWYEAPPVVTWLSGIWEGIKGFWNNTILGVAKPVWNAIAKFGSDTWSWITEQFGTKMNSGYRNGKLESWIEQPPIVKWLSGIWEGIETFWNDVILGSAAPLWNAIAKFGSNTWAWITQQFGVTVNSGYRNGRLESWYDKAPVVTWLSGIWEGIKGFWNNTILGVAKPVWNAIAQFGSNTWAWIQKQFGVTVNSGYRNGRLESWYDKAPVVTWLSGIWEGIEKFWNETILGIAMPVWEAISEFAGNTWSWICDLFGKSEESIDSTPKENSVVAWLTKAWEDIESFWNNTILGTAKPVWNAIAQFAGNTWGWISSQFTPSGKVVSGYRNGKLESWYEEAPIVSWLSGIWDGVKEVWNAISGWEGWGKIGEFLSETWTWITELFTESNEATETIDEQTKTGKSDPKQTQEKLDFFSSIINAIGDFVAKIVGAINGAIIPEGIQKFLENIGAFLEGILTVIGKVMGAFGRAATGKMKDNDLGIVITSIAGIIGILVAKFFMSKWSSKLADTDSFGSSFMKMAGGLLMIAAAIALLTTIDQTKMWPAVGAITVLGAVVGAIIALLSKLNESRGPKTVLTGGQKILNNLINQVGKIGALATVLSLLPGVIKSIGEVKKDLDGADIGSDLLNTMLGVSALITSVSLAFAGVQMLTGKTGLDPVATFKTALALIVGIGTIVLAFTAAGGLLSLFGDKAPEDVARMINGVAEVMSAVGGAIGGFLGALFNGGSNEQKTEAAGRQLETISEMANKFSDDQIAGISRMMALLSQLTSNSTTVDTGKLRDFSESMSHIGSGIYEFIRHITLEDTAPALAAIKDPSTEIYQKVQNYIDIGKRIGEMLDSWDDIHLRDALDRLDTLQEEANMQKLVNSMNNIIRGLGDVDSPDTGIQFDGVQIVKKLYDAIQVGLVDPSLPAFDATSVVNAISEAIGLGSNPIALRVRRMIQAALDNTTSQENGGGLNFNNEDLEFLKTITSGDGLNVDLTSLTSQLYGEDGKGGILGEIQGLANKIPTMESIFADKGWLNFTDSNGQDIDILSEIQGKFTEITDSLATTDPIEVKITPVFNITDATRDKLQNALDTELGGNPLTVGATYENPTVTIDFKTLSSELDMAGIHAKLQSMIYTLSVADANNRDAISRLGNDIDNIADAISGMKLVLDTGILAGQITPKIDALLGQRSRTYGRTGVVYVNP